MRLLRLAQLPAGLALAAVPVSVLAEVGTSGSLVSASYLFQVLGSLLLVLGLVFGLVFLLKKVNGLPLGGRAPIRVLGSVRIGSREKLVLVQAGEQQLLVGVAPGGIRTLHTFDEPVVGGDEPDTGSKAGLQQAGDSFAGLLKRSRNEGSEK